MFHLHLKKKTYEPVLASLDRIRYYFYPTDQRFKQYMHIEVMLSV
jgi:hypothetical protein